MTLSLDLNQSQREAVEHLEGPLLVLAGAGSGKTRVLTARLARLIQAHGVHPSRILAVTFTNKAAGEMRGRVAELLAHEPAGLWIGTFHAMCARLLRREAPLIGFGSNFSIYDEDDSEALVRRLVEDLQLPAKLFHPGGVRHAISRAKNAMVTVEEFAAAARDPYGAGVARVYAALEVALRRANAMDFDDLLLHPLALFAGHPDRLAAYRGRFEHVLVDEFQDTNRAQYLLVRALAGEDGNLFVVGDDDQSIYGWRGADLRNVLDFRREFPSARLVRLEENYRSTAPILDAANGVIGRNTGRLGKTLFTRRTGGELVTVVRAADERDEAEWLAREFRRRSEAGEHGFGEMAVLVRTNAQSLAFEEAFRAAGIPYRIVGAVSFYDRREIKDVVAYLRLLANPDDDEAFRRAVGVPRRGLGEQSLAALADAASARGSSLARAAQSAGRVADLRPPAQERLGAFAALIARLRERTAGKQPLEILRAVIQAADLERHYLEEDPSGVDRWDNVQELMAAAAAWSEEFGAAEEELDSPLERFLAHAALTTRADQRADPACVAVMTLHAAKGLEFPLVAIAGLEEGLLPLGRADSEEALEEERRLCYVGITRAKDRVYLSHAVARRRGGGLRRAIPSRFLADVPPGLIEERLTRPSWSLAREPALRPFARRASLALIGDDDEPARGAPDSRPRYVAGERVHHRRFGSGTIRAVSGRGAELRLAVEFDDDAVGLKQLLAAYAALEREDG